MADSLLALLVIFSLTSTLYAIEHKSVSLEVKIERFRNEEIPKGRQTYTIDFTEDALELFRSCLHQPGSLSCCTDLTTSRSGLRKYEASSTDPRCKDDQIDKNADVFECFISLNKNFDATLIVCAKVSQEKASDGKHSRTLWLSIFNTAGIFCVDVMWGNHQTIQDIQPPTDIQETEVKLKGGHCQNVSKEPAVSPLMTKTAEPATTITTTTAAATTAPSSTTLISTSNAAAHKEVKNENQNEDNASLFLIIGVAAAAVVVIIIIIIISLVIWRRKKHQKIPITCNTASAYEYIDTTELVSQRDRTIDEAGGNPAVSSSTPLKNDNKRNKIEGDRINAVVDTYVSPEEIIRNKRAATACGGDDDVTGDQGTEFISNNDTDHYTVPSLQLVSSNTHDSHYETQYDNVETSAQDSTASATNIYSRLGEQVRNFQNPYSDWKNFKLNATTESCPADVNPSEPIMTTSTENVGPTVHTEPARQPFISTAYEYVDISQPLKNIL